MRGSPPLHLLLLAAVFALVAIPLARLTGARAGEAATAAGMALADGERLVVEGVDEHPDEEHAHRVATRVRIYFAHRPQAVRLLAGEKDLLAGFDASGIEAPMETEADLAIGHEGHELVLEATWPEGTPLTAVTVELEPEGLEARSETRWAAEAEVSDVLTFVW